MRLPGGQPVNVAVIHAECRCNQHRVVNLGIRCSLLAGGIHSGACHVLSSTLHLPRNDQQSLQLFRNVRFIEFNVDLFDRFAAAQVAGRCSAVAGLAEVAVIQRGDVRRYEFSLAG